MWMQREPEKKITLNGSLQVSVAGVNSCVYCEFCSAVPAQNLRVASVAVHMSGGTAGLTGSAG